MKIGILWENFEPGGVTTHLENLLNDKVFKSYEFVIFTNRTNKATLILKKKLKEKNVKFHYYNSLNVIFFKNIILKFIFFILRPFLFFMSIIQFFFILKNYRFDILLAECGGYGDFRSEVSGILASNFLKFPTKLLLIHHSFTKPYIWNFLLRMIDYLINKSINGLIFVSKATKKNIKLNTNLFSPKLKTKIIYNGVKNNPDDKSLTKINKLFKNSKTLKIGILSRVEKNKGHEDLINAFNELPCKIKKKIKVYFIGNCSKEYLIELKQKLNNLNLRKYFVITGYIHEDSFKILKKLDLLISLTKDFEGFGLSLAEALSAKTPVLATKVGGVMEFLNNKNSKLIKPNNKNELKLALLNFVKNKSAWKQRSKVGKTLIDKSFSSKKMAKNYKNFFNFISNQKT